jgi:hypothetical protein
MAKYISLHPVLKQWALPTFQHQPREVLEWLKRHAWKACTPQGVEGSNPFLSAG